MAAAVGIYLLFNAGSDSAHGWAVAMSTDTAFALGLLALFGSRFPDRLRAFMVTMVVLDDLVALIVIATVYTEDLSISALVVALGLFAVVLVFRALHVRGGLVYFALGAAIWVALLEAGIEPVVVGLVFGLMVWAYPAARSDLQRATEGSGFRGQTSRTSPARRAQGFGPRCHERAAQKLYHPDEYGSSLFALANAGIAINGDFLSRAYNRRSRSGSVRLRGRPRCPRGSWLVARLSRGRLRPAGWAASRRRRDRLASRHTPPSSRWFDGALGGPAS
jgi:Na+/H+ antiporter NhaA